jgi:hypothetical protein
MIDPQHVPEVDAGEFLARFATQSGQFRADKTVKQDLFIPTANGEVSVMRHRDATVAEIWMIGRAVAAGMGRTLYGRSDVLARACATIGLRVDATPMPPDNPNHADINGWPEAKEDRKALAQKLAAVAGKLISPP